MLGLWLNKRRARGGICQTGLLFLSGIIDYVSSLWQNKILTESDAVLKGSTCLTFNNSAKVLCQNICNTTNNPRIRRYIKPTNFSGVRLIAACRETNLAGQRWQAYLNAGKLSFAVWNNNTTIYIVTAALSLTSAWYEIDCYYDRANSKIVAAYRTCPTTAGGAFGSWVVAETLSIPSITFTPATKFDVGGANWGTGIEFVGSMLDIEVSDFVTNEVLARFKMTECVGGDVYESVTGNVYTITGTLTGTRSVIQDFKHLNQSDGFDLWTYDASPFDTTKYLRVPRRNNGSAIKTSGDVIPGYTWKSYNAPMQDGHNLAESLVDIPRVVLTDFVDLSDNNVGVNLFMEPVISNNTHVGFKNILGYYYKVGYSISYTSFNVAAFKATWSNATIIEVKKDLTGDYDSIRAACMSHDGIIMVYQGTYYEQDIQVKNNTWLVAVGEVIIDADGTSTDLSPDDYYFSAWKNMPYNTIPNIYKHTFWVAATCIIEGFTIKGKDVKYCIHGDNPNAAAYQSLILNNYIEKSEIADIESGSIVGLGLWKNHSQVYINNEFSINRNGFTDKVYQCGVYCHTGSLVQTNSSYIILENNTFNTKLHALKYDDLNITGQLDCYVLYNNQVTDEDRGVYVNSATCSLLGIFMFGLLHNVYKQYVGNPVSLLYFSSSKALLMNQANYVENAYVDEHPFLSYNYDKNCLNNTIVSTKSAVTHNGIKVTNNGEYVTFYKNL